MRMQKPREMNVKKKEKAIFYNCLSATPGACRRLYQKETTMSKKKHLVRPIQEAKEETVCGSLFQYGGYLTARLLSHPYDNDQTSGNSNQREKKEQLEPKKQKRYIPGILTNQVTDPQKQQNASPLPHPASLLPGTGWWSTGEIRLRENRHCLQRLQTAHCPCLTRKVTLHLRLLLGMLLLSQHTGTERVRATRY